MDQLWWVITAIVLVTVWRIVWHRRRYPDRACRRCGGAGRLKSTRPLTGRLVSRLCPRCGGTPWTPHHQ